MPCVDSQFRYTSFPYLKKTNLCLSSTLQTKIKLVKMRGDVHKNISFTTTLHPPVQGRPFFVLFKRPLSQLDIRQTSISLTSHSDSLHSFILLASSSSPNLFSYFKFGQTWSETKTLQIVLESFCVHSPAHASFYFS